MVRIILTVFFFYSNGRLKLTTENDDDDEIQHSYLTIHKIEANDTGNYTCEQYGPIDGDSSPVKKQFTISTVILPRIVAQSAARIETKISQSVLLFCVIEVYPLEDFKKNIRWVKEDVSNGNSIFKNPAATSHSSKDDQAFIANRTKIQELDKQRVNITLDIVNIYKKDNGSYSCIVEIPYDYGDDQVFANSRRVSATSSVFVLDVPQVSLDFVKAVGASQIFLNWTVNNGNSPIKQYYIQYIKEGESNFFHYKTPISGKNTSCVLDNFDPNTSYKLRISAQNAIGSSSGYDYPHAVRTLELDPVFVPTIEVKGNTIDTITIGWHPPPSQLLEYIHYYELVVAERANDSVIVETASYPQNSRNLPYMFDNVSIRFSLFFLKIST